jgi:polysaccharide deacetylase 2 family uncharacterized protein YibQ
MPPDYVPPQAPSTYNTVDTVEDDLADLYELEQLDRELVLDNDRPTLSILEQLQELDNLYE